MAGILLFHPTVRPEAGAQFAVYTVETEQAYPVPYLCPLCGRAETRKTIHLRIGHNGGVIVSQEIWEKLKPVLHSSGLDMLGGVENPPPQTVGAVELPKQQIIHVPLNGDKKYADKYNPGRTKYESRDRLRIPKIVFRRRKHG